MTIKDRLIVSSLPKLLILIDIFFRGLRRLSKGRLRLIAFESKVKRSIQYLIQRKFRKASIETLKKRELKKSEILLKISVVMPVFNTNLAFLKEAVKSVTDQIYPN